MKRNFIFILFISILMTFFSTAVYALNPFITHVYTADPSAHVFENRVYVYTSHDNDEDTGFFDMKDYHVFSSADLTNWIDHGVILRVADVKWSDNNFWAPDCAYKNGKYYLYFPAHEKGKPAINPGQPDNWKIGVAIGNSPAGPFVPLDSYIPGTQSVDPCIFIDDDGDSYLFFGGMGHGGYSKDQASKFGKLRQNMIEFEYGSDGKPIIKSTSGAQYYFEAPWVFSRVNPVDGKKWYYLSYSIGGNKSPNQDDLSEIDYAMTQDIDSGQWIHKDAVITNKEGQGGIKTLGWTIHQSFTQFKGDWYAFYHTAEMTMGDDSGRRSICMDKMYFNDDGTMQIVSKTKEGPYGTCAFSRIKAMLFSGKKEGSEIKCTEYAGGGDIGRNVGWIKTDDFVYYNNVDFGSMGAFGFEAEVASGNDGGTIEIRKDSESGNVLGVLTVDNTGGWHNWVTKSTTVGNRITGKTKIYLVFKKKSNSSSTYLLNLNAFRFTYAESVPIGLPVALKSKNPESIDNNEYLVNGNFNKGSEGQKYLCADRYLGYDLCANRESIGKENKFTILNTNLNISGDQRYDYIQFNSSSNGQNLKVIDREFQAIINAMGNDYKTATDSECFYWIMNDDNTILLRNLYNSRLALVKTWESKDPARVYCDSDNSNGDFERFYCEVQDAPIGFTVAFKTLDLFKKRTGDTSYGELAQMYLCADSWNMGGDAGALCATRSEIGYDSSNGEWEKFLVVDAKNGYIALKSFNKDSGHNLNHPYLRVDQNDKICKLNGGNTIDSDYERFQWINNGDGTISLRNIGANQILSVVNVDASGNLTNPAKVYANKSKVSNDPGSHEKFYCQIVAPAKN